MTSTQYLIGFLVAAVLAFAISLGGMTMAYFVSKRDASRPRATSRRGGRDASADS
jgi:hypothetical protein